MVCIVHMSVLVHTTAPRSICPCVRLCRCSVPIWMNFRTFGCLLASQGGITLTTRVHRSLSTTVSPTVSSWCELPVQCAEVGLHMGVTWCSDFKLCLLPTGYTQCPQVQTGPTRTVTSDLMSATLAEAATQFSFAAFLERCISVSAPPPPPLPIRTPLLDAATQTFPHIAVCQDVSTQLSLEEFSLRCVHPYSSSGALAAPPTHDVLCPTCFRPVPSLLLDAAGFVQRRISRCLHSNYRSWSSSSGVSSPMTL